jgi:hypothetical protein
MKLWGPDLHRTKMSMESINEIIRDGKYLKEAIKKTDIERTI